MKSHDDQQTRTRHRNPNKRAKYFISMVQTMTGALIGIILISVFGIIIFTFVIKAFLTTEEMHIQVLNSAITLVATSLAAVLGYFLGRSSNDKPEAAPQNDTPREPLKSDSPTETDEEVHFTALHPRKSPVDIWQTLFIYVHVETALEKVHVDAKRFLDELQTPKEVSAPAHSRLKRGTEIMIVPACEGVTFNPEQSSLKWLEDYHRTEFRFRADPSLQGDAVRGEITFYVGPLIVGTLKFAMLFNNGPDGPLVYHEEKSMMYHKDKIFISYSHKDTEIVLAFKKVHEATGYDVLIDIDNLRSGQEWNPELMGMIDRADIFQLFWSENSKNSKYCQQEWKHALQRNIEGFIRPIYWQKPIPNPPKQLRKYHFEYVEL